MPANVTKLLNQLKKEYPQLADEPLLDEIESASYGEEGAEPGAEGADPEFDEGGGPTGPMDFDLDLGGETDEEVAASDDSAPEFDEGESEEDAVPAPKAKKKAKRPPPPFA